jgi:8-oxo-dGTP pyrophosphatase MutT (NUDIX family)
MNIPNWVINTLNKIFAKSGYILCPKNKPYLPWPTAFSTVDVAIVDPYKNQILLGKKRATGKWCIIGGFTDPSSSCDAEDAIRELDEETGISANINDLRYIGDFKIPDGRYENTPHAIRTHYFILRTRVEDVKIGKPFTDKAGDFLRKNIALLPQSVKWLMFNIIFCHVKNEKDIKSIGQVIQNCSNFMIKILDQMKKETIKKVYLMINKGL